MSSFLRDLDGSTVGKTKGVTETEPIPPSPQRGIRLHCAAAGPRLTVFQRYGDTFCHHVNAVAELDPGAASFLPETDLDLGALIQ